MHKIIASSLEVSPLSFTEAHQEISDLIDQFTQAATKRAINHLFPCASKILQKLLPLFENPSLFSNIYTHLLATKILTYCLLAPDLHLFSKESLRQFSKTTNTESLESLIDFCNEKSYALYTQNLKTLSQKNIIGQDISDRFQKNQTLINIFKSQNTIGAQQGTVDTERKIYLNHSLIGSLFIYEHIGDGNCFYQAIIDAIDLQENHDNPPCLKNVKSPDLLRDISHSLSETTFKQWHHLEVNPNLEAHKILEENPIEKDIFMKNLYLEISNLMREYAKPCTLKIQFDTIPIPKILREHPLLTISLDTHFKILMQQQHNLYTNPDIFSNSENPELIPGALEKLIPDDALRLLIGPQIEARLNELVQVFMAMGGTETSKHPDNLELFDQCFPCVALSEILMAAGTQFDESSQTLLKNPIIKALGEAYIADIDINQSLFKQPELTYVTQEGRELSIKEIATKKYATSPEISIFTQILPIQISLANQTGDIHVITNIETTDTVLLKTLQNPQTIHLFLENGHYGVLSDKRPQPKSKKRNASPEIEHEKRRKESDPSLLSINPSSQEIDMRDYKLTPLVASGTFWQVLEYHLSQAHSEKILGKTYPSIQEAFIAKHDDLIQTKNPSYLNLIKEQIVDIAEQIIDGDDEEIETTMPKTHAHAKNIIYDTCDTNKELQIDAVSLDILFQKRPQENSVIQSLREDLHDINNQELTCLPVSTLRFIAQEFGIYFAEQQGSELLYINTKQSAHELSDPNQILLFSFNEISGEMSLLSPK
ncbi:MAG: hypothetical protein EXS67_04690 [Candidatus Margulisbacteria bacterium]|nr:hypothetical protein [Candidatus Margulisiibacteriota bacterium]